MALWEYIQNIENLMKTQRVGPFENTLKILKTWLKFKRVAFRKYIQNIESLIKIQGGPPFEIYHKYQEIN